MENCLIVVKIVNNTLIVRYMHTLTPAGIKNNCYEIILHAYVIMIGM